MTNKQFISVLICAASFSTVAIAKPKATPRYEFQFGPEFTVSNPALLQTFIDAGGGQNTVIIQTPESIQLLEDYGRLMKSQLIQSGRSPWRYAKVHDGSWSRNKLHFIDPAGFKIVALNDAGVIEVNHSAITVKNAVRRGPRLQKVIFDNLKSMGVEPMAYVGAGHIHMDLEGFRGNLRLFRDFLVDFHNHPGLTLGGLNHDRYNAVGMSEMTDAQKQKFREVVNKVDSGKINTIPQFIRNLKSSVFIDVAHDPLIGRSRAKKYYATSFAPSYERFGTMELRCIRPQASYQTFIHQIQMFEERVNYLAKKIELGEPPIQIGDLEPVSVEIALRQFDSYVTEAGLDFANYKPMVLDWWQSPGGELEQYQKSQKKRRAGSKATAKVCSALARS